MSTLNDFKSRDWNTLTDKEKRLAVVLIWGWTIKIIPNWFADESGKETLPAYRLVPPATAPYADDFQPEYFKTQAEAVESIYNPLTDPGAAMDAWIALAVKGEHNIKLDYEGVYWREWGVGWHFIPFDAGAVLPALCEAIFCSWQLMARQEVSR